MEQDIRWKQRFANYEKALDKLSDAIETYGLNPDDIVKEGIIQRFEFTHELAWKVMKDYFEYEGNQNITGSRTATKIAFNNGIIENGQGWMNMIESRNKAVHTYQEEILSVEFNNIVETYLQLFIDFSKKMKTLL